MELQRLYWMTLFGGANVRTSNDAPTEPTMTLAERYNDTASRLLPHMAADLRVDPAITSANEIDEIVFRRSEYLGGMAVALLAMIDRQD
jgi:hypothetical protein